MDLIDAIKKHFTRNQLIFIFGLLLVGFFIRWWNIEARPLHHDESLHALYSRHMFENVDKYFYKYDPMLHGPLLYHLVPFFYEIFGVNKFSIRFLPALISTFFLIFPLFFYNRFQKRSFLFLYALLSLSPSLIYWGRFLREDVLMHITLLFGALTLISENKFLKSFSLFTFLLLPFMIKENAYIHPVLVMAFLFYEFILEKHKEETFWKQLINIVKENKWGAITAVFINAMLFLYLYTGGLRWSDGLFQNMFTDGLSYWLTQHENERIPGPFLYQSLILSSYDFVFFISMIVCGIHLYLSESKKLKIICLGSLGTLFLIYPLFNGLDVANNDLFKWSKFKTTADFYFFLIIFVHAIISTTLLLKRKEKSLAILNYLFWSFLFTYSFLGERVPWLASYPLWFGLFFLGLYSERFIFFTKNIFRYVLIFIVLFTLRMALKTNISEAGGANQLLAQVHTTEIFENVLKKIKNEIDFPIQKQPQFLALGETVWPTSFYFYGEPHYHFALRDREMKDFDYVLTEVPNDIADNELKSSYTKIILPFRHWWVPDYTKLNIINWISYALTHNPWSDSGTKDAALYSRINSR